MSDRPLSAKDLAYDAIHKEWHQVITKYDTQRRIEVLVNDWLSDQPLGDKRVLEVGSGLGYFAEALAQRGPKEFVATDLAPTLVENLARHLPACDCRVADAMNLEASLGERLFDLVFSSEVIEHTPDPQIAVREMCRRVAPGGLFIVSCPNRRWIFLLILAQSVGLRKHYQGYENWVKPDDLVRWIREENLEILKTEGIHTVPWHFLPLAVLRFLDKKLRRSNYRWSLNLAVMARRRT
jgi:2-polyprenyl-3-methyl-5-hydroxy-6-metoxy-1,4-benzoquinol methylase